MCNLQNACATCDPGFDLIANKCVKAVLESVSSTCPVTSFKSTGGQCQSCSSVTPNCSKCVNSSKCVECATGFEINLDQNICEQDCGAGKYLNANGQCQNCINNCSSCTGPNQCTKCSSGFIENAARTRCDFCDTEQGFFIDSLGACRACDSNCSKCEEANFCLNCKSGYTIQ